VLVHVPGAMVHAAITAVAPGVADRLLPFDAQLGSLLLGALVPLLFFRMLSRLGYPTRAAMWTAVMLGAGTSVWVYALRPYSEMLQVACFVFFFDTLLQASSLPSRRVMIRLGVAAALLINAKNVYFACLPGAAAFLVLPLRKSDGDVRDLRNLLRPLAWGGVGFLPGLVALAAYNAARWGSPLRSGYEAVTVGFWSENILVGLWGQLFSYGRSVFLYSPPLIFALFGVGRLVRRRRYVATAAALVIGPLILLYSHYVFWSGDWGWGPRYLVFALPVFLLPAAELCADAFERGRRGLQVALAAALVVGVAAQVLGTAFYWDHFLALSGKAQRLALKDVQRPPTVLARAACQTCVELVSIAQSFPAMTPIAGHWWLLRHKLAGDDWTSAEADAPWKRYTSRVLDLRSTYDAADLDWWPAVGCRRARGRD